MIRVVADTNIFISALMFGGLPAPSLISLFGESTIFLCALERTEGSHWILRRAQASFDKPINGVWPATILASSPTWRNRVESFVRYSRFAVKLSLFASLAARAPISNLRIP
jgi:hypothetical protein